MTAPSKGGKVSEATTSVETDSTEDEEDEMVRRASTPTLASLFKKGKERGLLTGGHSYGG